MYGKLKIGLTAALIAAAPVLGHQDLPEESDAVEAVGSTTEQAVAPADRILESLSNSDLHLLVSETLVRNPGVARAQALARAADLRAPQVPQSPSKPELGQRVGSGRFAHDGLDGVLDVVAAK